MGDPENVEYIDVDYDNDSEYIESIAKDSLDLTDEHHLWLMGIRRPTIDDLKKYVKNDLELCHLVGFAIDHFIDMARENESGGNYYVIDKTSDNDNVDDEEPKGGFVIC